MITVRCRGKMILFIIISGIIFLILQVYLVCEFNKISYKAADNMPVILWWTPFIGDRNLMLDCGNAHCYVTQNRSFKFSLNIKAILFYGSDFKVHDLPLPRLQTEQWGLLHEESPRNNPILTQEDVLNLFNHSATFSRYSDVPFTLVDLPSLEELLSTKYVVELGKKNLMIAKENLAPVLYIQSDCNTASERDAYVSRLMRFIKIDSYGSCLNNRELPKSLKKSYLDNLNSEEFLSFTARYKFTLAFENAVCEDYITEKLWRPLIVGSVPIYYGSPSFEDWLPNNNSAISVTDFTGPEQLADFLNHLHHNDSEYMKYMHHKTSNTINKITNKRLLTALKNRKKSATNEFGNYVEAFQCIVCQNIQKSSLPHNKIVTRKMYDCPIPKNPLTGLIDKKNFWVNQWESEKCSAKLLAAYVISNVSINLHQFEDEKMKLYDNHDC